MRLRLPPKQAFPHSISYKEIVGEDDWGKPSYSDPVELPHVRFDESFDFKRQGVNATEDAPNALITMFNYYNPDIPEFQTQSIVTFKTKEFTILKVVPLYYLTDEVIGYELEVK